MGIWQRPFPIEIHPRDLPKNTPHLSENCSFRSEKPAIITEKNPTKSSKTANCLPIFPRGKQLLADPAVLMPEVENELAGF